MDMHHLTVTPEDWEGFEALLSDTTFQDKEAIMKIVTSNMHPDRKEEIIRMRFPAFYRFVLKHWFVILRHSDYTVEYHVRPFTIEESQKVFDTNPKNLSLEEMFRLALTYTPGSATYNKIFMTAVQDRSRLSRKSSAITGNDAGQRCLMFPARQL